MQVARNRLVERRRQNHLAKAQGQPTATIAVTAAAEAHAAHPMLDAAALAGSGGGGGGEEALAPAAPGGASGGRVPESGAGRVSGVDSYRWGGDGLIDRATRA